jgi:phospholipid-transporting ATPase
MITAAHVGVGIKGVEGQQAARASDYSIGEFKILRRLLLFVGREAYRKNSHLILYNFYKNMVFVLPHFWYAFLNGFSGSLLYDPWIYQFFNLFYAALPIIIYAVFDEEYPSEKMLNVRNAKASSLENSPHLYEQGMKSLLFNRGSFWFWFLNGAWQGAMVVFIA